MKFLLFKHTSAHFTQMSRLYIPLTLDLRTAKVFSAKTRAR